MNSFRFYQAVPVFSWTLILVIILLHSFIAPIISILTIFKGILFTTAVNNFKQLLHDKYLFFIFIFKVILTIVASFQTKIEVTNDFSATGDSFLMSLVSLGEMSYYLFFNTLI
jgi:hypothetical protein